MQNEPTSREPITRELVIASLRHCSGDARCVGCPCGGSPVCEEIYKAAADMLSSDETEKFKQYAKISFLEDKITRFTQDKAEAIKKMWDSMMQVQQVYSNRCKELEEEIARLKGR